MQRCKAVIASFYSSAAGMLGQIDQQDVISNNLANCNSSGYKRQRVGFSAFSAEMASAMKSPPTAGTEHARCMIPVAFARQDGGQGEMQDTSSATNLAIDGAGCFVVSTSHGQILTRDGNFRVNDKKQLVTMEGDPVLGRQGPISVSAKDWQIDANGRVKADGAVIDTIRIEMPKDAPAGSKPGQVVQGRIENSNVNAVQETAGMITALRAYEANQKAIQAIDQTLDKIINQAGRA
jgi:flagellar basal-body rod protein FlgF